MIEVIAVTRDVVIILASVLITGAVLVAGRAVLGLAQRAEELRVDVAANVVSPIKRGLRILHRVGRGGRV